MHLSQHGLIFVHLCFDMIGIDDRCKIGVDTEELYLLSDASKRHEMFIDTTSVIMKAFLSFSKVSQKLIHSIERTVLAQIIHTVYSTT